MHTIKITPNLLFEYQCTSGKFIRLPNRIETFLPELECSSPWQRRQNGGGDGGARPRNVETTGARVSYRPPGNIFSHFCMLFLKLPLFVVVLPTYN